MNDQQSQKQINHKIGIIGIGMVGKPLERYFREVKGLKRGEDLFLYDINHKKFYTDDVNRADIVFATVPTPNGLNGDYNLSAVESVVGMMQGNKIVVVKSTVPPGTTERLQNEYPQHKILFNPEFLTESQAWSDMIKPDRQIVGFTDKSIDAAHVVLRLLPMAPFMSPWGSGYNKHMLTATEAELAKLFGNAFFSWKVTFVNHLADTCEQLSADYENVRKALGADYRIGMSHTDINHGNYRGFGGYCLPKDLDGLIAFLERIGMDKELFDTIRKRNNELLKRQGLEIGHVNSHIDVDDPL